MGNAYQTTFPTTENPISESSRWINGLAVGGNWTDVQSDGAHAHPTMSSGGSTYDDSIACLTGTWGNAQRATATAFINSYNSNEANVEEIELLLRCNISAGNAHGYEVLFSVRQTNPYFQLVRWNGDQADYDYLDVTVVDSSVIEDGDVLTAVCYGTNPVYIDVYKNGALLMYGWDDGEFGTPFVDGSPGIGFYHANGNTTRNLEFGWSDFAAKDFEHIALAADADDGYEFANNTWYTSGYGATGINYAGYWDGAPCYLGLSFELPAIPADATIESAHVRLYRAIHYGNTSQQMIVRVEDADPATATPFSSSHWPHQASWIRSNAAFSRAWDSGAWFFGEFDLQPINLAQDLQDLLTKYGAIASGDRINIALWSEDSSGNSDVGFYDYAYGSLRPELVIVYTEAGSASWAAAENAALTAPAGTKRLRVQVNHTGDPSSVTPTFAWRLKPSGGSYGPIRRIR